MGEPLTPELAGTAVVDLVSRESESVANAYLLNGAGLERRP